MKGEIKFFVYAFVLGLTLVAYAHANFASKFTILQMYQDIREIRKTTTAIKTLLKDKI